MTSVRTLVLGLALALAAPAAAQAAKAPRYYVSLGDSYATGYQATAVGQGHNTRNGFAYQLPGIARARGYDFKLVNFACAGETTSTLLHRTIACPQKTLDGPTYTGRTQVAAAARFLARHRGQVDLVTVSIGGNDVTSCARAIEPIACVATAVEGIEQNVGALAQRLRRAAGPKTRIVGITYPDVVLGQWVGPDANQQLATLSVVAFQSLINPALKTAYESVGGKFVDVTAATGAYGSLDETTTLEPYGVIPVPVARVCRLSYYCDLRDIHARTNGYRLIARLIAKKLPKRG